MFQDYIDEVRKTAASKGLYKVMDEQLEHGIIGIAGEAGELLDQFKRAKFYGMELDRDNVLEELGDIMWFMALTMDRMGFTLNEVLAANIRKLRKRYNKEWTQDECLNRNLEAEIDALLNAWDGIEDIHTKEERQGSWCA